MTNKGKMAEKTLTSSRCQCPSCDLYFNSTVAFDKHRVWVHKLRKNVCMTPSDMENKGMAVNDAGFWVTKPWKGDIYEKV